MDGRNSPYSYFVIILRLFIRNITQIEKQISQGYKAVGSIPARANGFYAQSAL